MTDEVPYPFQSMTFTIVEGSLPRRAFRMRALESGMYELHAERGSAANPLSQFTREVPLETAQGLKDALQEIGVFGWDESYPAQAGQPARRWTLNTVFKEGVFAVSSKGGGVPARFDAMLEELYRLDFPRPDGGRAKTDAPRQGVGLGTMLNSMGSLGLGSIGGMSAGDLGAYGVAGTGGTGEFDFSQLAGMFSGGDAGDIQDMIAQMQRDPQALQQRMKDEFRHMGPDEQDRLLDMLASLGGHSRAWWERFLRGL